MEVVLQQDFPSLGYVGDRVTVRGGYARNYLIPRGIAVEAASRNARQLEHRLAGIRANKARLKKVAEEKAQELRSLRLKFTLKIGEHGKSFGSISARDIQEALEQRGYAFDRKQIRLPDQIKSGGSFAVEVRLHSEVTVQVPIDVEAEVVQRAAEKPKKAEAREAEEGADETLEAGDESETDEF